MQRQGESDEVVGWLVQRLRWAHGPVTRDQLAQDLRVHAAETWGYRWEPATAARRVREAIKAARRHGWPVVSLGSGFRLARTAEERHRAAERIREMARDLLAEASRLEETPVPGDLVQGELFEAAAGGGR
ncbi:MAG: hypothetical protein ACOY3Y_03580 [Acidobacteriota bacterium]